MTALVLDHVTKTYTTGAGEVTALRDFTLEVGDGECVAVIGESGSGKSTMARLVMGLEAPTSGLVLVAGSAPTTVAQGRAGGGSAIVLQDPSDALDPRLSVGTIVAEPLRVSGKRIPRSEIRKRVSDALAQVHLDDSLLKRRPNELSGGQQQRVGIARALVREPEFLVLDEPTSALDPSVQAQVMKLIQELQDRLRIAVLLITHDIAVAATMADRIAVLRYGHIVEVGPSRALWDNAQHPYTRSLLEAATYAPIDHTPSPLPEDAAARRCIFFDVCRGSGPDPCSGDTGDHLIEVEVDHVVAENCHVRADRICTPASTATRAR